MGNMTNPSRMPYAGVRVLTALAIVGLVGSQRAYAAPRPAAMAALQLQDAAPSMDVLIARFLTALATKDRSALRRMRVSKREYIDVIMPGSIEPGGIRRTFPDDKATYFWDT